MANKKNDFFINIKYFYKKHILIPFLNLQKNKIKDKSHVIKVNIGREGSKNKNKDNKIKNKVSLAIKSLKSAKKELWIEEFRSFLIMLSFVLLFTFILIGSIDAFHDINNLKTHAVYAQDMITSSINDLQNSNIQIAKDKLSLVFDSSYNISSKVKFIAKVSVGAFGRLINFSEKDLNEVIRSCDNISTAVVKAFNDIQKFSDRNNLYKIDEVKNASLVVDINLKTINSDLEKINTRFLPKKYQSQFLDYKKQLKDFEKIVDDVYFASNVVSYIMGQDSSRRILFIFENANELRATGGFMGSYALVDFKDGNVINYEVPGGGIYDLRAGFTKTLEPPYPFKILVNKWEIQDANWFFDFEKSAKKIIEFFEPSSRTSVDGIIVINSNMMSGLMDLIGDIKLDDYNVILTKYNIIDELQNIIGKQRDKTNKPKVVIGELFEKVSEQLLNKKDLDLMKIYNLFNDARDKKQILAYIKDLNIQNYINVLGISGKIVDTNDNEDYLAIVDTNIGGGKTSQYIDRSVNQQIDILGNGDIIKTLVINKKYIKQNNNFDIKNVEFLRIYVPSGSQFISATGFDNIQIDNHIYANYNTDPDLESLNKLSIRDFNTNTIIYNDEGETIFGNFIYLNPGEQKEIVIKYKLPFKVDFDENGNCKYTLYLEKQSGVDNLKYNISINTSSTNKFYNDIILNKDKKIELTLKK